MYKLINPNNAIPSPKVQDYCALPYPDHPNGCPNIGVVRPIKGVRKDLTDRFVRECPPCALETSILDYNKDLYVIYTTFNVGMDAKSRMDDPNTSLSHMGQFYNLRYWQGRARSDLYSEAERFLDEFGDMVVDLCPEAHGVNLLKLMYAETGINLRYNDWPVKEHNPSLIKYQICLAGYPVESQF